MSKMILSTTEHIPGREVAEVLGVVKGNTIRARHVGSDIAAGLKGLVGGEIKGYVKVMTDAREEAEARMLAEAEKMGADAVLAVRFSTASVMAGAAEMLAYGTAVKLR